MSQFLPWIALILGLGTLGFGWSKSSRKKLDNVPLVGLTLVAAGLLPALLLLIVGAMRPEAGSLIEWVPYLVGLVLGGFGVLALDALDEGDQFLGAGLAALFGFAMFFCVKDAEGILAARNVWSFALAASAAACALGWSGRGRSAGQAAGLALAVSTLAYLGQVRGLENAVEGPTALGIVAAVAGLGAWLLQKGTKNRAMADVAGIVLLAGAGWVIAWRVINLPSAGWGYVAGAVAALALHWAVDRDLNKRSSLFGIAALVWLGVATFAYSRSAGYGISSAALGGLSGLILLGRSRLILTMSPLLVLAAYRAFREAFGTQTAAFDIGQHYGMIGVLAAVLLVVALLDFVKTIPDRAGMRATMTGAFAAMSFGAAIAAGSLLLSTKGVVGLIVGFGVAPVVAAMSGVRSSVAMAISAVSVAFLSVFYSAAVELASKPRDERLGLIGGVFAAALIFAVAAWFAARQSKGNTNEQPAV
jgi:hypothetical protein